MASLISSAVRSPIATPYSRRTYAPMAASMSNPPTRTASSATTPPSEMTATSDVPPPTSTTMLPSGSWIGSDAPGGRGPGRSVRERPAPPAAALAAERFMEGARRAEGAAHRLLDQEGLRRAGAPRRFEDGALLD